MSNYITHLKVDDQPSRTVIRDSEVESTTIVAPEVQITRITEGMPGPVPENAVTSQGIDDMVVLTQAEYDALPVKNPRTFYLIASEP